MKYCHPAIAIVVAMWPALSAGQQTVVDREHKRDKGIKKITEVRFEYVDGQRTKTGAKWGYHQYDQRGNHIVNGRYSAGGGTEQGHPMYLRVYDDQNRPIKRIWYCNRTKDNPAGSICLVFKNYKLDQHGNVKEENGYDPDGRFFARVTFERDREGRPLQRTDHVENDPSAQKRHVYKYDDAAGKIETSIFGHAGTLIEKTVTVNKYDNRGNISETRHYDADGKFKGRSAHRFDEAGLKIETVTFDQNDQPVLMKRFDYEFHDR